jgi:hypothetical protein
MMAEVASNLAEILAHSPDAVLPLGSIGPRVPSNGGELPSIAISLTLDSSVSLGLGRLVRSWDQLPDGDTVREETRGDRYQGIVSLEIWAGSSGQAAAISQSLEARLERDRLPLRDRGFVALQPAGFAAAENVMHPPATSAAFAAWKQRLAYRFVFETREGGELASGERIARIDVDLVEPPERFAAP